MATAADFEPFELPAAPPGAPGPRLFAMAIPSSLRRGTRHPEWLSDAENAAMAAMGSATRRAQFAAGRWLLHHCARKALGEGVRYRLRLIDERPFLSVDGAREPIAASLSHSADQVLCAIAPSGLVGVDVERIRPRNEWDQLAAFVLHPAERSRAEASTEAARWRGFYRVWTLKEALAKALGVGLALPFNRILFSDDNRIAEAPRAPEFAEGLWHFYTPAVGAEYATAAAWRERGA